MAAAPASGVSKPAVAAPQKPANAPAPAPAAAPSAPKPGVPPAAGAGAAGAVSAEVAMQHFRDVLRAKQERVRQGPSYPAPNAFTGRHDGAPTSSGEDDE
ncbi:MAG TPA: hypothetical protein VFS55_11930 [Dokdonella sp.]|nr:hypothetical protein [Dokdonella sp.]